MHDGMMLHKPGASVPTPRGMTRYQTVHRGIRQCTMERESLTFIREA